MSARLCAIDDCERLVSVRGWCHMHYQRWRKHGDPLKTLPRRLDYRGRDMMERIQEHIRVDAETGCWMWQLSCTSTGYGQLSFGRAVRIAVHRAAYEYVNGPLPRGIHLHHACERRACCNPKHLEVLTPSEHATLHKAKARAKAEVA